MVNNELLIISLQHLSAILFAFAKVHHFHAECKSLGGRDVDR